MSIKSWFEKKIKPVFTQYAFTAVSYAEDYLGSGAGQAKKEIAINYLIGFLPKYLKPFTAIFRKAVTAIADHLIERAVERLHSLQNLEKDL